MPTTLDPLISEFETQEQADSYNKWFRAKVQEALEDPQYISHDEAMAEVDQMLVKIRKSILRLEWSRQSRRDLSEIQFYIERSNPRAAASFRKIIEEGAERLTFMSFAFAARVPGTREYIVHPNYILVYKVGDDAVKILRIIHARREYP